MAPVKNTISLLCKYLHLSLNVNIKSEHFRLAKFDEVEEDTVGHLWSILHKVLSRIIKPNPIFTEDDGPVVTFVKLHFALLNYECIEFYCLPRNMSYGSRELLLAFGWLFATQNAFETLLHDTLIKSSLRNEFGAGTEKEEEEDGEDEEFNEESEPMSLEEEMDFILWAAGCIKNNVNAIYESCDARMKDMAEIHQSTLNASGLPHLSVHEVATLQDAELYEAYLTDAEAIVQLIETHQQWESECDIFWEWMGSVVVEKEKSQPHSINMEQKNNLIEIINDIRLQMQTFMGGDFEDACENIPPADPDGDSEGMPRFMFAPTEKETEIGQWLPETEKIIQSLNIECKLKQEKVREQLHRMMQQMEDIEVVGKSKVTLQHGTV